MIDTQRHVAWIWGRAKIMAQTRSQGSRHQPLQTIGRATPRRWRKTILALQQIWPMQALQYRQLTTYINQTPTSSSPSSRRLHHRQCRWKISWTPKCRKPLYVSMTCTLVGQMAHADYLCFPLSKPALTPQNPIIPPNIASQQRTSTPARQVNGNAESAPPMPSKAASHGAPARRYLNEKVTGVLLEGMKRLAADQ